MDCTFDELYEAMTTYGGSFIKKLAALMLAADPINRQKLIKAFPEYIKHYSQLAMANRTSPTP